jgi:Flp pilus assembly protein TadD
MSTIEEVSTESLRESGFSLHENGNFAQAERTYREVLLRTPGDGEVTYALGVLAVQTGRYQMAVDNLTAVIAAGATADTYDYLGSALHGLSRLDDALQNHERAIALNPAHAAARIGPADYPR